MSIGSAFKISDNAFKWGSAYVDGLSKGTRDGLAIQEEYRKQAEFEEKQRQQTASLARQSAQDTFNNGLRSSEESRRQQLFNERGASGGAGKVSGNMADRMQSVYQDAFQEAQKRGYTNPHAVASAFVAGAIPESNLNPNARNPNDVGKESVGLIQWRGERNDALRTYAQSRGESGWGSQKTQVSHFFNELDGSERRTGDAMRGAGNPNDALRALVGNIRFAGYNQAGHPELRKRYDALNQVVSRASAGGWGDRANDGLRNAGDRGTTASGEYGVPDIRPPAQPKVAQSAAPTLAPPLQEGPPSSPAQPTPPPVALGDIPTRTPGPTTPRSFLPSKINYMTPADTGQVLDQFGELVPPQETSPQKDTAEQPQYEDPPVDQAPYEDLAPPPVEPATYQQDPYQVDPYGDQEA